jgi:hypothetical protein
VDADAVSRLERLLVGDDAARAAGRVGELDPVAQAEGRPLDGGTGAGDAAARFVVCRLAVRRPWLMRAAAIAAVRLEALRIEEHLLRAGRRLVLRERGQRCRHERGEQHDARPHHEAFFPFDFDDDFGALLA